MKELISNPSFWIMLASAFLAALSQILLKLSANKKYKNKLYEILNPLVLSGYVILLCTMFMNIIAYRGLDYKIGPILNSTTYIFVILLSLMILKEKIAKNKFMGIMLIILGLIVFNM
ncbi:EamA family transporter [Allocoprobacillus halotolerans]|uniref:EamA family transporter n=1 Tax=Allocoprobacillus halotolerans TaxID=2944914 RepID=A0ABY5HYF6_9FIRM|nr:EamA family transporter [Allocoprobacillus halotolerans]UTY38108.1 EamA family transporter [Allocoprobacillus halotolerans]